MSARADAHTMRQMRTFCEVAGRGEETSRERGGDGQARCLQDLVNDIWYVSQFLFGLTSCSWATWPTGPGTSPGSWAFFLSSAGLGYAADSFGAVLSEGPWTDISAFTFLGEFLLALWLVIRARGVAAGAAELEAAPAPRRETDAINS